MSTTIETDLLERGPFLVELGQRLEESRVAGRLGLLGVRQSPRPIIITLEDVHWADEATLDVLRLVARRVEAVPALFVASYRDDELDRFHPLRTVLGDLATLPAVSRLRRVPLL